MFELQPLERYDHVKKVQDSAHQDGLKDFVQVASALYHYSLKNAYPINL